MTKTGFKRMMAALMCLCLLALGGVQADETSLKQLFSHARDALTMLADGDVDGALDKLDFRFEEGSGMSEDGFRNFVSDSFSMLDTSTLQVEVAVCYLDGDLWRLGIPVAEPVSDEVEVLMLDSRDGKTFCGYKSSTWKELTAAAARGKETVWNREYTPAAPKLMADD